MDDVNPTPEVTPETVEVVTPEAEVAPTDAVEPSEEPVEPDTI